MKNLFSVAGKVAVVTGGSSGIGAMIARGFVENGVKTYITARKLEQLQQTAGAVCGEEAEQTPQPIMPDVDLVKAEEAMAKASVRLSDDLSAIDGVLRVLDRLKALG